MSRSRRAVLGSGVSLLQYAVTMALQFALAPAVIHYAGRDALGAYAVLMQAIGFLGLLDLGFSVAYTRHLSQAMAKPDGDDEFMIVLASGAFFVGATNIASAAVLAALAAGLQFFLDLPPHLLEDARGGLLVLAAWTAVRTPLVVRSVALLARQDLVFRHVASTVGSVLRLMASLGAVVYGFGLFGMIVAAVVGEAADGILCCLRWRCTRPRSQRRRFRPDALVIREILAIGGYSLLMNVAVRMVFSSDAVILGWLCGPVAASMYYTTQAAASLGWALVWRVTDSAWPGINQLWAGENSKAVDSVYLRLHRYALILGLPLASGVLAMNEAFVLLWVGPEQYVGSVMTAVVAAFALVTISSHVDYLFRYASGALSQLSIVAVVEGIVHVVLAIVFASRWGATGVAVAGLIPHLAMAVFVNTTTRAVLGVSLRTFLRFSVAPAVVSSVASSSFLFAMTRFMPPSKWSTFAGMVAASLTIHVLSVSLVGLHPVERRLVVSAWKALSFTRSRLGS